MCQWSVTSQDAQLMMHVPFGECPGEVFFLFSSMSGSHNEPSTREGELESLYSDKMYSCNLRTKNVLPGKLVKMLLVKLGEKLRPHKRVSMVQWIWLGRDTASHFVPDRRHVGTFYTPHDRIRMLIFFYWSSHLSGLYVLLTMVGQRLTCLRITVQPEIFHIWAIVKHNVSVSQMQIASVSNKPEGLSSLQICSCSGCKYNPLLECFQPDKLAGETPVVSPINRQSCT